MKDRSAVVRQTGYEERRMDILRRSAMAFAEDGYHQTSVNSLAERLGVSKPVLYYYAKNKDDLLFQIGQVAREQLAAAMDRATHPDISGMAKIRRFFTTYADIMGSDFGRCFVLVHPNSLAGRAREIDVAHRRELERSVREMIEAGQADGSVRACDSALVARALFGLFNGLPLWFRPSGELSATDVADSFLDLFVHGVGRG